jgi:hypothetical protein
VPSQVRIVPLAGECGTLGLEYIMRNADFAFHVFWTALAGYGWGGNATAKRTQKVVENNEQRF